MGRRILVVDGHPDRDPARLCHALARSYVEGARELGHETRLIVLSEADFPMLRAANDFATPPTVPAIVSAQADIQWADHIVFVFPLWVGAAPAFFRAFLEQVARGEFLAAASAGVPKGKLKGKSARLIVTMGMPALAYRLMFGAHGVKAVMVSALRFCGAAPVRMTLLGAVETGGASAHQKRLARVRDLGRKAA
jgi:putative NADPH-quinone reductase